MSSPAYSTDDALRDDAMLQTEPTTYAKKNAPISMQMDATMRSALECAGWKEEHSVGRHIASALTDVMATHGDGEDACNDKCHMTDRCDVPAYHIAVTNSRNCHHRPIKCNSVDGRGSRWIDSSTVFYQ